MVKLSIQDSRTIPEGSHPGRIAAIDTRETQFGTYLDIVVDILDKDGKLLGSPTVGMPARITPGTDLGKLLKKFGIDVADVGADVDLDEILLRQPIQCSTHDVHTENGVFAEIDKDSLGPHPQLTLEDVWGGMGEQDSEVSE